MYGVVPTTPVCGSIKQTISIQPTRYFVIFPKNRRVHDVAFGGAARGEGKGREGLVANIFNTWELVDHQPAERERKRESKQYSTSLGGCGRVFCSLTLIDYFVVVRVYFSHLHRHAVE